MPVTCKIERCTKKCARYCTVTPEGESEPMFIPLCRFHYRRLVLKQVEESHLKEDGDSRPREEVAEVIMQ